MTGCRSDDVITNGTLLGIGCGSRSAGNMIFNVLLVTTSRALMPVRLGVAAPSSLVVMAGLIAGLEGLRALNTTVRAALVINCLCSTGFRSLDIFICYLINIIMRKCIAISEGRSALCVTSSAVLIVNCRGCTICLGLEVFRCYVLVDVRVRKRVAVFLTATLTNCLCSAGCSTTGMTTEVVTILIRSCTCLTTGCAAVVVYCLGCTTCCGYKVIIGRLLL